MKEVEVKILNINRKLLETKLRKIGARKVFEGTLRALYYDYPDGRFKKRGEVLRLRGKGEKNELVFKRRLPAKRARVMEEIETHVEDFKAAQKIFGGLGLRVIKEIKKTRASYALGKHRFEIDKYPGIPAFLEIESRSVREVQKLLKRLGFCASEAKNWNAFELLNYYRRKGVRS